MLSEMVCGELNISRQREQEYWAGIYMFLNIKSGIYVISSPLILYLPAETKNWAQYKMNVIW